VRVFSSLIGEPSHSPDEINDEEGSERPDGLIGEIRSLVRVKYFNEYESDGRVSRGKFI